MYFFTSENITVALGGHSIKGPVGNGTIFVNISKIEIHENWNITSESFDADIAILTLAQNIEFSSRIQPICLVSINSAINTIDKGYVIGYGKSISDNVKHDLKYIHMQIINDNQVCLLSNPYITKLSSLQTFCAGTLNVSGVCNGDSGNGLFVNNFDVHYIRGIVSASLLKDDLLDCDKDKYAVFTNVLMFYDWIIQKIQSR